MVAGVAVESVTRKGAGGKYRVDIDGLRAVSILLVVAFHADLKGFGGGYVGVDVFFVLSGYLITGLLLAEFHRHGTISLREFYARRVRRLLPLAGVVLGTTLLAGLWLLSPLTRRDLIGDAVASAMYFVNWSFARQATAYSGAEVTESLLLHYWSLSVEEQFYILWPLLVIGLAGLLRRRRELFVPLLGIVLCVVIIASLWFSVTLSAMRGPEAYYVSHTRFWEMGVGGMLALILPHVGRLPRWAAQTAAVAGLAAICWSAVAYSSATSFPGVAALVPVLGTVALIVTGARQDTRISRILQTPPLPYLGRISYAWYLWHWPVIGIGLLAASRFDWQFEVWMVTSGAVIVSLLLAAVSHVVIENPLRHSRRLRASRPRSFAVGAAATGLPVAAALVFLVAGDTGSSVPVASPDTTTEQPAHPFFVMSPHRASQDDVTVGPPECHVSQEEVRPNFACVLGDPGGSTSVVLMGDSHARHWLPALDRAGQKRGWRVLAMTKSACTPIDVRIWNANFSREYTECAEWRTAVLRQLHDYGGVELVILGRSHAYSSLVLDKQGTKSALEQVPDLWSEGAQRTFEGLLQITDQVVVLRDTPWATEDVPTCFSDHPDDPSACALDLEQRARLDEILSGAERAVAPVGVEFLDPTHLVCREDPCPMITADGLIKYSDRHHLTQSYSQHLAYEFGEFIEPTLPGSG